MSTWKKNSNQRNFRNFHKYLTQLEGEGAGENVLEINFLQ